VRKGTGEEKFDGGSSLDRGTDPSRRGGWSQEDPEEKEKPAASKVAALTGHGLEFDLRTVKKRIERGNC